MSMRVRAVANAAWVAGWTAGISAYAMGRQALGADPALYRRHTRLWARSLARGIGLDVVAYGTWRLDPDGAYLLMANHQSQVDIVALLLALPMVPGFVAKAELKKLPIVGRAIGVGGHVFVDRDKHGKAVQAIRAAARDIKDGKAILIFPEGTRSDRQEVLPFKKGAFHLAQQAEVPIVPIGLRGTAAILPKGGREIVPGRVEVRVGEPISVEDIAALGRKEVAERVRAAICELSGMPPSEMHRPSEPPPPPRPAADPA